MKEVDIISKVVGRDTSGKAAMYIPGAGAPSVNLDDYLLKKIWDSVFEIRTDSEGNPYLFEKMPLVTQYGITMYADGGELDLPSIYAGLPIDGRTLIRDDNGVLMINPDIDLGGGLTEVYWNDIKAKPTFATVATSGKYADLNGLPDLSAYATTEYLTAELKKYVTLNTEQTIAAHKNFLNGLSVGGLGITKSQDDVVYIDANLVVRGGITMYAEGEVDIPSILDSLPIASNTAKGIASFDSSYFSVDSNGKVTLLAENVGLNETELFDYLSRNNYAKKSDIPSLSGYATETYVEDRLDDLINGAPAAYDTLKEIADVLAGNVDSIGDIITTLGTKADKAIKISAGTGLSGGGTLEADRTLSLDTSGVTAGTYKSVTVDKYGRVTSGTNPTTLAGYGITDAYTKSAVDALLGNYVTLATSQTITGEKNFTGGLKVNGSPIVYDATNKYWKLEGDLLVTGGVTMFASDSAFTPSTIMNAIATDGTNLKVINGVLTFVGSIDGGEAGSVHWKNVEGKPSFASVATSGKYSDLSGTPTLLSSFTNDVGFITSYIDTKNTAGSTNTSSKIFLIGATSQAANPQTYSHDTAYVGTDGYLYSGGAKVLTAHQTIYNLTLQAGTFSAATFDPNGANKTVNIPTTTNHITEGDNLYYTNARAQAAITGGASTIVTSNLTTNRALISNARGKVAASAVTSTELGYLDGVTSAIQTQLDSKLAATSYTAADVIAKLLTVDGASSGLDADLLDGTHKSGLLTAASSSSATNLSITVGGTTKKITDLYAYKTTQLETARTIWGQSFDGTGNVSGALSGATTGAFSSNVTIGGTLSIGTTISSSEGRATLGLVSVGDNPTDFKMGNGSQVWSITARNNENRKNMWFYSYVSNNILIELDATFNAVRIGRGAESLTDYLDPEYSLDVVGPLRSNRGVFKSSSANILSLYRTSAGGGAWIDYYASNQSSSKWRVGTGGELNEFTWEAPDGNYPCRIIYDKTYGIRFEIGQNFLLTSPQSDPSRATLTLISTTDNPTDLIMGANNYDWSITARGSSDDYMLGFYSNRNSQYVTRMYRNGDVLVTGGISMYSDIRKKTKLQDVELSLKQIADAPLIEHYYNNDAMRTTHVGSIAQYWAEINDWFCKKDQDGFYTMEIQNAALASAISIARELVKYESKTDKEIRLLKDEVKRLKKEIKILKSA